MAGGVIGASLAAWHFYREQEKPVKLLTVGCMAKWNGQTYEIKRFFVDNQNQTRAVLSSKTAYVMAPVEELEAVNE